MIIGCIMETYKNIGLKMNADKSMMMMWEEMKKDRKSRESSEEKVVSFNLAFPFPTRKREVVTRVEPWNLGVDHMTWRRT